MDVVGVTGCGSWLPRLMFWGAGEWKIGRRRIRTIGDCLERCGVRCCGSDRATAMVNYCIVK